MTVIMVIMALAVVKLNNVTKTQLVNRTGQTFETGKVVRILEDNIQEDGMRVGQQTVVVKMTSGVKKGTGTYNYQQRRLSFLVQPAKWESGSGSPERCRKFSDHKRLFHGPERGNDRFCGTLSAGIVPGRRFAGRKRCSGTDLYFWGHSFYLSSRSLYGIFPFLDSRIYMCHYHRSDHVPYRRCFWKKQSVQSLGPYQESLLPGSQLLYFPDYQGSQGGMYQI